jgi:Cu+-exporting ATPase
MTTHLQSPIHLQLPLSGMSCANCAGRITTALNKLDGVSATVNFALEQAAIDLPARPFASGAGEHQGAGLRLRQ